MSPAGKAPPLHFLPTRITLPNKAAIRIPVLLSWNFATDFNGSKISPLYNTSLILETEYFPIADKLSTLKRGRDLRLANISKKPIFPCYSLVACEYKPHTAGTSANDPITIWIELILCDISLRYSSMSERICP